MDLHAGDMIEDLIPFVIYRETGDERVDGRARRMVDAYGADWVVKAMPTGERPGEASWAANVRVAVVATAGDRRDDRHRHSEPVGAADPAETDHHTRAQGHGRHLASPLPIPQSPSPPAVIAAARGR